MTLTVTEEQVQELLTPDEAFAAVSQAHIDLTSGKADNVVRTRSRTPSMSLHTLSAASTSLNLAAAKVYSGSRHGAKATVLLYNTQSGDLLALISANALGQRRTSAASAVATSVMATKEAKTLGVIGSGFQAQGIVNAYTAKSLGFDFKKILVFSRDQKKRENFCEIASKSCSIKIEAAESSTLLAQNSEIVVTATTSSKPVICEDDIKGVKHISAIGSNSLARVEIPGRAVTGAKLIAVDTKEVAAREAGDLLSPIENGKLYWSQIKELGELLLNKPQLPKTGYTLFCSQGAAIQDLYCAAAIYQKIRKA